MKKITFIVFTFLLTLGSASAQIVNITQSDINKAREIVSKMTLDEKISYISGYTDFSICPIPRLGLPEIKMADGPQGIRNVARSTMYPAGILSAATWNRQLINKLGCSLGQDARLHGINILLGPGVNMYRAPMCGRNFEYFGEDPYLASETAKHYIIGVQSQGVIATIKHFALNNQEWNRHHVSSDADERTIQEIYFPTFKKAVKEAHVGAIMNSYNLINGVHATENPWLNIHVLRDCWGFKGILMSDWESVYSGVGAVLGGLDLEMPSGRYMNKETLLPALKSGIISERMIDDKVCHIIQTLSAFGLLKQNQANTKDTDRELSTSASTALDIAREGIVLLKNKNSLLPLRGNIAIIGPNANITPTGGGSGSVTPFKTTTVAEGIKAIYNGKSSYIEDAKWLDTLKLEYKASYYTNKNLEGKPALVRKEAEINHEWKEDAPAPELPADGFSVKWESSFKSETDGIIKLMVRGDDGYRVFVNDKEVASDWTNHAVTEKEACVQIKKGNEYKIRMEYYDNIRDATAQLIIQTANTEKLRHALSKFDNVALCVGFTSNTEGENFDRPFELNTWQKSLIDLISKIKKNTIVIVNSGGSIDFGPWIDNVGAVLMAWYPGQEGGRAIAEILSGKISPSGKLPISIERKWEDNPCSKNYYDHRDVTHKRVLYSEGVFTGYRGFDRNGTAPLFPFGYGLSYTTFEYNNLKTEKGSDNNIKVSFDLKNTGKRDASEIVQIYVHDVESSVPRPLKELKNYEKVYLRKGETKHITLELNKDAFSFYDINAHDFIVEKGDFEILVGASSSDIKLRTTINL